MNVMMHADDANRAEKTAACRAVELPADAVGAVTEILRRAVGKRAGDLDEPTVMQILAAVGIATPKRLVWQMPDAVAPAPWAAETDRVVVKLVAQGVAHKSELAGVEIVPNTSDAIGAAFVRMRERANRAGVVMRGILVAEYVANSQPWLPARELLVSIRYDAGFGPVVAVGGGGKLAEWYANAMRPETAVVQRPTVLLPDEAAVVRMLQTSPWWPLLTAPVRGEAAIFETHDTTWHRHPLVGIVTALTAVAECFAPTNPHAEFAIEELEINPFIVADDRRIVAADGMGTARRCKPRPKPRPVEKLRRLVAPESAVIVGVSAREKNVGRTILDNLLEAGFPADRLCVLHPSAAEIAGVRCARRPDEIGFRADVAIVTIPASDAAVALIDTIVTDRHAHTFIVTTGGFGETQAGRKWQAELARIVEKSRDDADGGVLLTGPNCLGVTNRKAKLDTFFVPPSKAPHGAGWADAGVATVSQSGAFIAIQRANLRPHVDPTIAVSFGNQLDVTVAEYVEFLAARPDIATIAAVIEGFSTGSAAGAILGDTESPCDGRRLVRIAREMRLRGQRLVVFKAARTARGAVAAQSHTASIAGDYALFSTALRAAGAIEAETQAEMDGIVLALAAFRHRPIAGNRVAVVSNAGFECSVATDNLGPLNLATLSPATIEAIRAVLPAGVVDATNPVDLTPTTDARGVAAVVSALAADPNVDALLVSPTPMAPFLNALPSSPDHAEDLEQPDSLPNVLIECFRATSKPMLVVIDGGDHFRACRQKLLAAGVPTMPRIDTAIRTLAAIIAPE